MSLKEAVRRHKLGKFLINLAQPLIEDVIDPSPPPPPPPPPIRSAREYAYESWVAVNGDKTLRQEYGIRPNSVVLDVGGFEGQWASDIYSRYRCTIHIFEPIPGNAARIAKRFEHNSDISVHPIAIGGFTRNAVLTIDRDASSLFKSSDRCVEIPVEAFSEWYNRMGLSKIELMKINIEGAEYELLENMIETGVINYVEHIQVQFHDFIDDAERRMANITSRLRLTHLPTYRYRFVWENWRLREPGDKARFELKYRNIKAVSGVLDPDFVRDLVETFGLRVFIETGTYRDDTLGALLQNFELLVLIELNQALYDSAQEKFAAHSHSKVVLLQGNSDAQLANALDLACGRPSLIWLDGHYSGAGTSRGDANTPILVELESVLAYGSGQDVILIDDLRCFTDHIDTFDHDPALDGYPTAREIALILVEKGYSVFVVCDALFAIPQRQMNGVVASRVLRACTDLWLWELTSERRTEAEVEISNARGVEALSLLHIPEYVSAHKCYGMSGNYFYWRSLLTSSNDL